MTTIKIFLGGGVSLLEGNEKTIGYRPSVVDPAISKLNARTDADRFFIVKTFSDLIHEYCPEGQQEHYHRYLEKEADIALFIFDGKIGDKTKEEVERACNSCEKRNHPTVFFYGTNLAEDEEIVSYLNSKNQYFQHFSSKEQLIHLIQVDLSSWRRKSWWERLQYIWKHRKTEHFPKPIPPTPIPHYRTYICPAICAFAFVCMFSTIWLKGDAFSIMYLIFAQIWQVLFIGVIFNKRVLGVEKLWKGLLYLFFAIIFSYMACIFSIAI